MGVLQLRRPWGFSHEARRGPQGDSRAAPGNSCLHAHGEVTLELASAAPEGLAELIPTFLIQQVWVGPEILHF